MFNSIDMIRVFRHQIYKALFSLFLAIQLLNISIDPSDRERFGLTEDITFNEIESLSELLLEEVLEIEDCIPESDERDSDNIKTGFTAIALINANFQYNCTREINTITPPLTACSSFLSNGYLSRFTPPPRA